MHDAPKQPLAHTPICTPSETGSVSSHLLPDIPLVNLHRQIQEHAATFEQCFQTLLQKTDFIGGTAIQQFEAAFAQFCGVKHCIGVGNGTDALFLIFRALNLKPGDEVITTPMSFMATAEVFALLGVKVIFADIDPVTYTLDPDKVRPLITPRTKALLPVHLYGQPADMAALQALADAHHLYLIEDAAQAHGAVFQEKRVGSLGFAAAFSFYPGKNLGAFGDAGGVTTNDDALAEKVRMLANHGRLSKYEHQMEGVNSRLDTLQASILLAKLPHLEEWNQNRRQWAALYDAQLADFNGTPQTDTQVIKPNSAISKQCLQLPNSTPDRTSVYHLYVLQTAHRDALLEALKQAGVQAGIHYPIPLHLQPAFRYLGHKAGDFPVAEQLAQRCLSLPMFPELTAQEVHRVAAEIRNFMEGLE